MASTLGPYSLRCLIMSVIMKENYRAYIEKGSSMSEKRMLQNQNQNKLLK